MELGNAIFGNSRGEYPIERGEGFENELYRLFEAYAPSRDNSWREYGVEFENDVFSVFPYYWGDCTCGYDEKDYQWSAENEHESSCYQSALDRAMREWLEKHPEPEAQMHNTTVEEIELGVTFISSEPARSPSADMWRKWYAKKRRFEDKTYDKLCTQYGVDRKFGAAIHCTCDYRDRRHKFREKNDHDKNCPIVKPNFLFKPTGFSIQWYKYPLRDSYMSQNITLDEFKEIVSKCIESCKAFQHCLHLTGGDSTPSQALSTPDMFSTIEHEPTPAPRR
jgi:hypothetical protein